MGMLLPAVARAALKQRDCAPRRRSIPTTPRGSPARSGLSARGARRRRRAAVPGDARRIRGGGVRSRHDGSACLPRPSRGRRGARRDAPCGGYNLHWAWASGLLAGAAAAKRPAAGNRRRRPCRKCERNAPVIELSNVPLPLDAGLPGGDALVREAAARALGVPSGDVAEACVLKRSVDARKKGNVHFVATLAVALGRRGAGRTVAGRAGCVCAGRAGAPAPSARAAFRARSGRRGGAGGRAAPPWWWALGRPGCSARCTWPKRGCGRSWSSGARAWRNAPPRWPRSKRAARSIRRRNVQFGEGGAGTFSDGKLTTGTKSPQVRHVLETFVRAGAPEEVLWQAKPHIGTDLLPGVVRALRERIVAAGGEVRFHTQLVGLHFEDGLLAAVDLQDVRGGATERLAAQRVVLACGHSARDTFELVRAARSRDGAQAVLGRRAHRASATPGGPGAVRRGSAAPRAWSGRLPAGRPSAGRARRLHVLHVPGAARWSPPPARKAACARTA